MAFAAICLTQVLLIVFHNVRYLMPLILPMAVWAAAGVPIVHAWIKRRLTGASSQRLIAPTRSLALIAVTVAAILAAVHVVALGRLPLAMFNVSWRPVVAFAKSLAEANNTMRPVLVGQNTTAYYVNADYSPFPYADEATALRYFDKRGVKFVVLTKEDLKQAPYLPSWWAHGIPSDACHSGRRSREHSRGEGPVLQMAAKRRSGIESLTATPGLAGGRGAGVIADSGSLDRFSSRAGRWREKTMYVSHYVFLSWGRVERTPQQVASPRFRKDLDELVSNPPGKSAISPSFGNSRRSRPLHWRCL